MKLWILRPVDYEDPRTSATEFAEGSPWEPWYDKSFGFIVRAETEAEARQIAHKHAGNENGRWDFPKGIHYDLTPWLDEDESTCIELTADGEAGLVMMDFHAA